MIRRSRGSASVEALVMTPVLILLVSGVMYVHRRALAKQETLALARGCAFQYAVTGCPDDLASLTLCRDSVVGRASELDASLVANETRTARSILDRAGGWGLVSDLLRGLFGTGSRAVARRPYRAFSTDGHETASGGTYLVCNTRSEPWADRLKDVACGVAAKVHVESSMRWLKVCP